jgi:hypothetical protein
MKRVNRPLIKLLDFKFSKFPCLVVLKFNQKLQKLEFKQVKADSLHHVLYPYGFRQKVGSVITSMKTESRVDFNTIHQLQAMNFGGKRTFDLGKVLSVFPELKNSIFSSSRSAGSVKYVYKLF